MKTNDKSSNQNRTDKQIISTQTSKGKRAENTGNNNTDLNILSNQLPKKQKTESSNNVFHNKGTSTIEKTKRPIVTKTVLQGENSKKRKHDSKIIVSTLSDSTPKTSTQKNISTSDVKLTNSTQNITIDGNNNDVTGDRNELTGTRNVITGNDMVPIRVGGVMKIIEFGDMDGTRGYRTLDERGIRASATPAPPISPPISTRCSPWHRSRHADSDRSNDASDRSYGTGASC